MMNRLLFILILSLPRFLYGQSLQENYIDDFTRDTVKQTTWETIHRGNDFVCFVRTISDDSDKFVVIKLMIPNHSVFAINKGDKLMFKLENNEIIELLNSKYSLSCLGCGAKNMIGSEAMGIEVYYFLSNTQRQKLLDNSIMKMRIYTTEGYIESNINEKQDNRLSGCLRLIK